MENGGTGDGNPVQVGQIVKSPALHLSSQLLGLSMLTWSYQVPVLEVQNK